ncbi:MAG: 2-hydroxyacyl-CoA dehydratase family protein [Acidobacteriota bacterium]|nr:2-hydroxyacyl-CoA dehydratase family protein [Acidobacteriota bacterium]
MIAGTPSPLGFAKVHFAVESSGMMIVADESCTGTRYYTELVDEKPADLDGLMKAVADRYFSIDCSCFSPNTERLDNVVALAGEFRVRGVVQSVLQYCHGYNIEAKAVEKALAKRNIPSLKIVTDYSDEDIEQLRVRTDTFAELLKAK